MGPKYDTSKPRYTVVTQSPNGWDFEVLTEVEVAFWRSLGYTVIEHRWNGRIFVDVPTVKGT